MKDERTLRLTKCQLFWHYATFVLLLAFPVWATFKVGSSYISGTNGSRLDTIELLDRKSTRLNSSHANISYAVFCLKKTNTSANKRRTRDTEGTRGGFSRHASDTR